MLQMLTNRHKGEIGCSVACVQRNGKPDSHFPMCSVSQVGVGVLFYNIAPAPAEVTVLSQPTLNLANYSSPMVFAHGIQRVHYSMGFSPFALFTGCSPSCLNLKLSSRLYRRINRIRQVTLNGTSLGMTLSDCELTALAPRDIRYNPFLHQVEYPRLFINIRPESEEFGAQASPPSLEFDWIAE